MMNEQMKTLAMSMFDDKGKELLKIRSAEEEKMIQAVNDLYDAVGIDDRHEVPDEEERAEQLKEGIFALVNDDLEQFYAKEFAKRHLDVRPEQVEKYVDMETEEWDRQCARWAEAYRRRDIEGTDDELANQHVKSKFGVPRAVFEAEVVFWHDEKREEVLQRFFGGDPHREYKVFTGADVVEHGIRRVIAHVE